MTSNGGPVEILLVEDNPGDVYLTSEVLGEGRVDSRLHVVEDGVETLRFLRHEWPYESMPRPDLILLDLNLPRRDGREVLTEVKADPNLRNVPVVVLTTSQAERDVLRSYELHANAYVTKSSDLDRFVTVVKAIEDFWLTAVTFPRR
jgi:two-component system, chemotaxis family, response regulator Rcp1